MLTGSHGFRTQNAEIELEGDNRPVYSDKSQHTSPSNLQDKHTWISNDMQGRTSS